MNNKEIKKYLLKVKELITHNKATMIKVIL